MDVFSHGLWSVAALHSKYQKSPKKLFLAALFGTLPDIIAFLPVQIYFLFTGFRFGYDLFFPTPKNWIFSWAIESYNFTHSFVIFAVVLFIVWAWKKKFPLLLLPWGLHIAMDLFTHPDFFQTPFLFPLSSYRVPIGISWATPWLFFTNWILLVLIFGVILWQRHQEKKIKSV